MREPGLKLYFISVLNLKSKLWSLFYLWIPLQSWVKENRQSFNLDLQDSEVVEISQFVNNIEGEFCIFMQSSFNLPKMFSEKSNTEIPIGITVQQMDAQSKNRFHPFYSDYKKTHLGRVKTRFVLTRIGRLNVHAALRLTRESQHWFPCSYSMYIYKP